MKRIIKIFFSIFRRFFAKSKKINFYFFQFGGRSNRVNFLFPVNFNLDEHLAQYPPQEYGFPAGKVFRKDNAYAFLSLIASIPARNSDLIDEDGFVPIHMATVRNNIKDITPYKYYLLRTNVIEELGQYLPGVKSNCYKLTIQYSRHCKNLQPHASKMQLL